MPMRELLHTEFAGLLFRAGVSQAAFADLTGYTPRHVNSWCRGRARVPPWAAALAVVLRGHSPADIQQMVESATMWADGSGAPVTAGCGQPAADGHRDIRGAQPAG